MDDTWADTSTRDKTRSPDSQHNRQRCTLLTMAGGKTFTNNDRDALSKYDMEEARHGGIGSATPKGEMDEDLPITANRSAKWWYIAVHNITAMVGAGVLGLPYAMALLGEGTVFALPYPLTRAVTAAVDLP